MKNLKSRFLIIYLLLYLILPSTSLGGITLCIGEDGHTAIALNMDKNCCDTDASIAQAAPQSPEADDCLPCVDIPVSIGQEHRHAHSAPTVNHAARNISAALPSAVAPAKQTAYGLVNGHTARTIPNSVCDALRTVVLII